MADTLPLPNEILAALAGGKAIVAITDRNAVDLNDELELVGPDDSHPGYFALVVAVQPAASLADAAGDAVLLRVFSGSEPVLNDEEFATKRAEVEARWM
jgi:hypothetical protein